MDTLISSAILTVFGVLAVRWIFHNASRQMDRNLDEWKVQMDELFQEAEAEAEAARNLEEARAWRATTEAEIQAEWSDEEDLEGPAPPPSAADPAVTPST